MKACFEVYSLAFFIFQIYLNGIYNYGFTGYMIFTDRLNFSYNNATLKLV